MDTMDNCDACGAEMDAYVKAEEYGMCLDCSNKFWSHSSDGHACSWECVSNWQDYKVGA